MNKIIDQAELAAIGAPNAVVSVSPVVLPSPGRAVDLEMRVSAPVTGSELPIILLSHGQGKSNHLSSLNGYAPLVNYWAAHGFVVIQPTHLSSSTLNGDPRLTANGSEGPLFWRSRAEDMIRILDGLDAIEALVPQISGRLDHSRVAVVGHSMGGHTASMLLGMRVTDPKDGTVANLSDARIKAGVVLAAPGNGGADLNPTIAENFPFFRGPDFAHMTMPALVVVGDEDVSPHLTVRDADWHADPYTLSPGPKSLVTFFGAGHGLGGVSGYDVGETTDENPERVAAVQRLTSAYLRSALYSGDPAWSAASTAFAEKPSPLGKVEAK